MINYSSGMYSSLILYVDSANSGDVCINSVEITDHRIMPDYRI